MQAGLEPQVIVRAGANVVVHGSEGEQVKAETVDRWGLKVESKNKKIEIQIGGSGEVWAPAHSTVKIYAGKDLQVEGIHGRVDCAAGRNMTVRDIDWLGNASAGSKMNLHCTSLAEERPDFNAGSDLRLHVLDLKNARIQVKDLGGFWEGRIGDGEKLVLLKSGGNVTVVTDEEVTALPPDFILGNIEKPAEDN